MRDASGDSGAVRFRSEESTVLYSVADHVATISLNRPGRMNAICRPMLDRLAACLLQAEVDPGVRVPRPRSSPLQ